MILYVHKTSVTMQKGVSPMIKRKKNKNIEDIKFEIERWRSENKTKVETVLFPGEVEYLNELGILTKPLLFKITNNDVRKEKDCPNFIRYKKIRKNKKIFKLKKKECALLECQGIEYEPYSYVIYL